MSIKQASAPGKVNAGDIFYEATLADGQVRIHLPFAVDPGAFSRRLLREGFPLAHDPDTPDTQGWGPEFDPEGYYPYWVYPDPDGRDGYVFAFFPQPGDVTDTDGDGEQLRLGEHSIGLIRRWVPVLAALREPDREVPT